MKSLCSLTTVIYNYTCCMCVVVGGDVGQWLSTGHRIKHTQGVDSTT